MRRFIHCFQFAVFGMALAGCSYGQSRQTPHSAPTAIAPDENTVSELPTRQFTFTAGDPVGGLKASPVIILPTQCTRDGALFLDMLQPPSLMQQAIYAITQKSSRSFAMSAINDLHGIELTSFFPSDDHVSLLVRATKETSPSPGEAKVRQASYGFFVALFNRQGSYLKSLEFELPGVLPSHIAKLTSGEYLVTGYDRANDMPRLYLIADDGNVIRSLVLPYTLGEYVPSADPYSGKGMMNRARVLGSILMTARGDQVLVWRRGVRGPILSVGAHGSTREISLNLPKDLTLAGVLPSDKLWVLQLQTAQHGPDHDKNTGETSYYQFDPSDGSLTSRLSFSGDSPDHTPAIIACEEEGTLLSVKTDDKGQTRILSSR